MYTHTHSHTQNKHLAEEDDDEPARLWLFPYIFSPQMIRRSYIIVKSCCSATPGDFNECWDRRLDCLKLSFEVLELRRRRPTTKSHRKGNDV